MEFELRLGCSVAGEVLLVSDATLKNVYFQEFKHTGTYRSILYRQPGGGKVAVELTAIGWSSRHGWVVVMLRLDVGWWFDGS